MTKTILTTMALAASLLTLNSCKKDKNDGPQQPVTKLIEGNAQQLQNLILNYTVI